MFQSVNVIHWCEWTIHNWMMPNTMLMLMVIAEQCNERTTTTTVGAAKNKKKNQLFESNWFWTLSFTYGTYFWRAHTTHTLVLNAVVVAVSVFAFPFNNMCHRMLNLQYSTQLLLLQHDHCMWACSLAHSTIFSFYLQNRLNKIHAERGTERESRAERTANVLVFTQSRQYVNIMWMFKLAFFSDDSAYNVRHAHEDMWHRVSHLLLHWNRILHIDKVWKTANWLLIEARFNQIRMWSNSNILTHTQIQMGGIFGCLSAMFSFGFKFRHIVLRIQWKSIQVKWVAKTWTFAFDEHD